MYSVNPKTLGNSTVSGSAGKNKMWTLQPPMMKPWSLPQNAVRCNSSGLCMCTQYLLSIRSDCQNANPTDKSFWQEFNTILIVCATYLLRSYMWDQYVISLNWYISLLSSSTTRLQSRNDGACITRIIRLINRTSEPNDSFDHRLIITPFVPNCKSL